MPDALVYSCSGCSTVAQMANQLAVALDRQGIAEMSCIAGVGGDIPSLVRVAKSGRPIIALDGCPLACVKGCLSRHGADPAIHLILTEFDVKKRFHADFDQEQFERLLDRITAIIAANGLTSVQAGCTPGFTGQSS